MQLGHNRKMSGAQCLADMLKGYGVTHVFHVPAVLRTTFAEMERRTDIKRLHVHGEKAAAYMADGYARASGKPGICMAQVIGALNLAAGLRDAWLAHAPVIAMTGGREPKTKFRKVYQEIDDMPAFEPVTKFNATVDDVVRFPDMVRQAFRAAVTGCPGPVHLQFRGNEGQIDAEEADIEPLVEPQFARAPAFRPEPDAESVGRQSYMRSAGHLGWAFPAGLGAKCACPERPVVTFTGDAGFWYHIAEVETAARWNINAVTVVNNNGGGNQSKRGFDRVYGGQQTAKARELWTFSKVDFARIAQDMGALGIRVEQASAFPAALAQALAAERPAVIDVVTDIDALAPTAAV
jgi:thiamine pyrophosphate-dependent acetolactate synthase large subunit-like protein